MKTKMFLLGVLFLMSNSMAQTDTICIAPYDQKETALAIDPNNSLHLICMYNHFITSTTPHRSNLGYAYTTNGGLSWDSNLLPSRPDPYPTVDSEFGFDPSGVFDNSSNFYYTFITHNRFGTASSSTVYLSKTSNNGDIWQHYQVSNLDNKQDKCLMTIDNTEGTYQDRIYITWQDQSELDNGITKIKFKYTTNNNPVTFSDEIQIAGLRSSVGPSLLHIFDPTGSTGPFLQSAFPVVDKDGSLYIFWVQFSSSISNSPAILKMKKSTNGGASFGSETNLITFPLIWKFPITAMRPSSWVSAVTDPQNGNLYVAYTQYDNENLNIYMIRSTNSGGNWAEPISLNGISSDHQFMPWLSVGSSGIVSLFYCEGNSTSIDYFIAQSHNYGQSFQSLPYKVTTESSNPQNAYLTGLHAGDYIGVIQIDDDDLYPVWFSFNENTGADIYGAKVNPPSLMPSNLYITGGTGEHPTLHWNANEELDLAGYKIYYSINQGNDIYLTTVNNSTTSYTDNGVVITNNKSDPVVCYKITAVDLGANESAKTLPRCVSSNTFNKENVVEKSYEFSLQEAYPNPFNPETNIKYSIKENSFVSLRVFDILGNEVKTLVHENKEPGEYEVKFDGNNLSGGIYFYNLIAGDFVKTKKLILIK